MAKFNEMSFVTRLGIFALISVIVGAVYYFTYYNGANQANQQLSAKITAIKADNEKLRAYQPLLEQETRKMAILEQQIQRIKKVVPEDKDADQFIRLLHDTAAISGIEIRRYTAMQSSNHEFYSEVPFAIDIDGPYYSVLNFFQRVADLERIVNIDNLQMANTKTTSAAKVKGSYPYAPGETVVASCTATTFFSHEQEAVPATPPGAARPGQPAAPPAK